MHLLKLLEEKVKILLWEDYFSNAIFGGIGGAIGGSGLMSGNTAANAFIAFGGKNFFTTMATSQLTTYAVKHVVAGMFTGSTISGAYGRVVNSLNLNPNNNFIGF